MEYALLLGSRGAKVVGKEWSRSVTTVEACSPFILPCGVCSE